MKNPSEKPYSNPEKELPHALKETADKIDELIHGVVDDYEGYVFANEIVTHILNSEQQRAFSPHISALTALCEASGFTLTQTDEGLQLRLQKLDITL